MLTQRCELPYLPSVPLEVLGILHVDEKPAGIDGSQTLDIHLEDEVGPTSHPQEEKGCFARTIAAVTEVDEKRPVVEPIDTQDRCVIQGSIECLLEVLLGIEFLD